MLCVPQILCPVLFCTLDVSLLRALVAPEKKQDELPSDLAEVNAIPRPECEASLPDALAKLLNITQIARFET
jgi:hypothetical protein